MKWILLIIFFGVFASLLYLAKPTLSGEITSSILSENDSESAVSSDVSTEENTELTQ